MDNLTYVKLTQNDLGLIITKKIPLIQFFGGDFNARVGANLVDEGVNFDILGDKLLPNDKNENGDELLLFCQNNNLTIVNSFFSYPQNGVGTSPPNLFNHTLDHILIEKKVFKYIVLEAGVLDSFELPTDHRITVVTIFKNYSNSKKTTDLSKNISRKRKNEMRNVSLLVSDKPLAKKYKSVMEKELNIPNLIMQLDEKSLLVNDIVDKLIKTCFKVNEICIPKIKKRTQPSWIKQQPALIKLINNRNNAYKVWRKNRTNSTLYDKYMCLKRNVNVSF